MTSKVSKAGLFALLVVAGVGIVWLRRDDERLNRREADLRRQHEQIVALRTENDRARSLVARASESSSDAADAVHAEVVKLRGEIADLEKRAEERHAKGKANGAALAANRDPEKGLVRMENFRNAGRSTPSAAFQTMIWAATKGDDQLAASLLTFDAGVREQAQALISALPEGMRTKYSSPESLAALFFAEVVTGHEAARVLSQTLQDPQHATVTIAFNPTSEGQLLTMQLGAAGWQLVVPEKAIDALKKRINQVSAAPPRT